MTRIVVALVAGLLTFVALAVRTHTRLAAENLFLRKQLALYVERHVKPRRGNHATRIALVVLSRFIDWRNALTVVRPDTLVRWHRRGFRLFWHLKSRRPGRPRIPASLQRLIAEMSLANRTWGEERIAAELRLTLGIAELSPQTFCTRPRELSSHGRTDWQRRISRFSGGVERGERAG